MHTAFGGPNTDQSMPTCSLGTCCQLACEVLAQVCQVSLQALGCILFALPAGSLWFDGAWPATQARSLPLSIHQTDAPHSACMGWCPAPIALHKQCWCVQALRSVNALASSHACHSLCSEPAHPPGVGWWPAVPRPHSGTCSACMPIQPVINPWNAQGQLRVRAEALSQVERKWKALVRGIGQASLLHPPARRRRHACGGDH